MQDKIPFADMGWPDPEPGPVTAREEFRSAVRSAATCHGNADAYYLLDEHQLAAIFTAGEAYRNSGADPDGALAARRDALTYAASRLEARAGEVREKLTRDAYESAALMVRQQIEGS